jgi:hypothetical protein
MRARPDLAALAIAALVSTACTGTTREVALTVRSDSFGASGPNGVDRYRLDVSRRSSTTLRWERIFACVYLRGSTAMGGVVDAGGPDASSCFSTAGGHHLLRPGPGTNPDDPVLVVVQAGTGGTLESFQPRGLPAVAQFRFPPGRGDLTLGLEQECESLDPNSRQNLSPYYTCVVAEQSGQRCPVFSPICVAFDNQGHSYRTQCADDPGGVAPPAGDGGAPLDAASGPSCAVDRMPGRGPADGFAGASARPGQTVRYQGCATFETCGATGEWSRCLEASPCIARAPGEPCCAGSIVSPMCSPVEREVAARCTSGSACNAATQRCEPCGGRDAPCCADGSPCASNSLACVSGTCRCGSRGLPCCDGSACDAAANLTCDSGASPPVCRPCGHQGDLCCDAALGERCVNNALTGLSCQRDAATDLSTCEPCGASNQPCCSPQQCIAGYTCTGDPANRRCLRCGAALEGSPCCADTPQGSCAGQFVCDPTCVATTGDPSQCVCRHCGLNAESCCAGGLCDNQQVCNNAGTQCIHCGMSGERCCPTGLCLPGLRCDGTTDRCR